MNVQFKDGVQLPLECWQHDHMRNIIRAAMRMKYNSAAGRETRG